MQLTGLPLDQGWVGQLPIEVPIHRPTEAETGIDVANPRPIQAVVIADSDRQRPSGSGPTGLPPTPAAPPTRPDPAQSQSD